MLTKKNGSMEILLVFYWIFSLISFLALGQNNDQPVPTLRPCERNEACRIVEYHPIITETDLASGQLEGSGEADGQSLSTTTLEEEGSFSYHETSSMTVTSTQICSCPDSGGSDQMDSQNQCPGENSTDTSTTVNLDSVLSLKLCRPKFQSLPKCRDHKNPVVRVFIDPHHHSSMVGQGPAYVKAKIWCHCLSGNFPKSEHEEVWARSKQVAVAYRCSRYKL